MYRRALICRRTLASSSFSSSSTLTVAPKPKLFPQKQRFQFRIRTMSTSTPITEQFKILKNYTACDIADALLKLKVPNAGFLPDLNLISTSTSDVLIAPASTVAFIPKDLPLDFSCSPQANIPQGKHWVDLVEPETIVVLSQPEGQRCAVLGGIMALRMKVLQAKGIVVGGRVRDVLELRETGLPIWANGSSIIGSGAESKPYAIQIPISINGTSVSPGDFVFSDPINGVVVIPKDKLSEVISLLPRLVEADEKVKADVKKGMSVQEAFKRHRG